MSMLSYVHQLFNTDNLPRLSPYVTVERSPAAMSPLPKPRDRSLGQLPLPARVQTLLVQWLQSATFNDLTNIDASE